MSVADTQADSAAEAPAEAPVRQRRPLPSARRNQEPTHVIDLATLFGLAASFALIVGAIALSGSLASFVNAPGILIVFGGTLCVILISFSGRELIHAQQVILKTVIRRPGDLTASATRLLEISERTRTAKLEGLKASLPNPADEPFLTQALNLVMDGTKPEEIERLLTQDLEAQRSRHAKSVAILRRAAEVAPAMGLIGTLVGLVQMLSSLNDPSRIGPAMAVALLTTFYGAVLANLVFAPLATKLERNSDEELMLNTLQAMGAVSIARKENPRRLEIQLNTILPPTKRLDYFD